MGTWFAIQAAAPARLQQLGFSSWLLVGFVLIILGVIWLLDQTSTIVMPVILAAVLGAVAGPAVGWLEGHRVPRFGGAVIVLLGLVAIGVVIFLLVFGGISANSTEISANLNQALAKLQSWLSDLGVDNAQSVTQDVQAAAPEIRTTLLSGLSEDIGPQVTALLPRVRGPQHAVRAQGRPCHARLHQPAPGVPVPTAEVVTGNVAKSLRSYFLGVTIIAAFNGIVIGGAALIVGVPLAGTIAVVTFVGAYVPFVGAWVARGFAVLIALGTEGTEAALIMAVVSLLANGVLQQLIQPFVMGATLGINPLVVLVVTIGCALFGMVGLTLAAPLTSAAVHIVNELRASGADLGLAVAPTPVPVMPDGTPT